VRKEHDNERGEIREKGDTMEKRKKMIVRNEGRKLGSELESRKNERSNDSGNGVKIKDDAI
jgi:hypothetical protein